MDVDAGAVLVLVLVVTEVLELEDEPVEEEEEDEDESVEEDADDEDEEEEEEEESVVVDDEDDELDELGEEVDEPLDDDGDVVLEDDMEVMSVGRLVDRLVDVIEKEVELMVGRLVTVIDVLTDVKLREEELDELEEVEELDEELGDVVRLNVSKMVEDVVVLEEGMVEEVSIPVPHTPSQPTICPPRHSVPGAVGPKLIRPPWSQMKKVVPSLPQKIWPLGEQLP